MIKQGDFLTLNEVVHYQFPYKAILDGTKYVTVLHQHPDDDRFFVIRHNNVEYTPTSVAYGKDLVIQQP